MTQIGSVTWPGPVGIAAGLIKGTAAFLDYAQHADSLEIGSITTESRKGNDGKTIWKYPEHSGLRHNAGIPNPGSLEIVDQLKEAQRQISIPWGLNLAVSPGIPEAQAAVQDISVCATQSLNGLEPAWLTLNVSSPDTQDKVEMLSEPDRVWALIQALKPVLANQKKPLPLWIKIGAGLPKTTYSKLGQIFLQSQVDAIVISNAMADSHGEVGGWTGQPIKAATLALLREMRQLTEGKIPLVAVGGILKGQDMVAKIQAGASAVQVASALLLRGRAAAADIRQEYDSLNTPTTSSQ